MTYNPTINTQDELRDLVENKLGINPLFDPNVSGQDVKAAMEAVEAYKDNAVNNFKEILKMSDSYTFEDGTKFVRSSEGDK